MKTTIKKKNDSLRELIVKLTWNDIKSDYVNEFNKIKSPDFKGLSTDTAFAC